MFFVSRKQAMSGDKVLLKGLGTRWGKRVGSGIDRQRVSVATGKVVEP